VRAVAERLGLALAAAADGDNGVESLHHIAVGIGARRSRPEVAFVIIKVTLLINRYNTNKLANYF
jgi:hypothetical protein